mmetsp:Transcript_8062/g.17936  ORF Transcript_8062/g.17936 Transcript_8062/m.17936 type:complete len:116 (+) Transcript_8062:157-504(+)
MPRSSTALLYIGKESSTARSSETAVRYSTTQHNTPSIHPSIGGHHRKCQQGIGWPTLRCGHTNRYATSTVPYRTDGRANQTGNKKTGPSGAPNTRNKKQPTLLDSAMPRAHRCWW